MPASQTAKTKRKCSRYFTRAGKPGRAWVGLAEIIDYRWSSKSEKLSEKLLESLLEKLLEITDPCVQPKQLKSVIIG